MKIRDGKELVIVVGVPKSGNTWLIRLVAEAMNSPIGSRKSKRPISAEGPNRTGNYYIIHDHGYEKDGCDNKVIYIYRDPRDVIVSMYFYWETRTMDDAIDKAFKRWKRRMDYWVFGNMADTIVTFEQLKEDAPFHLGRVLSEIGLVPVVDVNVVVAHQEINAKRREVEKDGDTRPHGKSFQLAFLRKGIVGDWKNHFTEENAKRVHDELYDYMNRLGYENDPQWWRKEKW